MTTNNQFEISYLIATIFIYILGFGVYFGFRKRKNRNKRSLPLRGNKK